MVCQSFLLTIILRVLLCLVDLALMWHKDISIRRPVKSNLLRSLVDDEIYFNLRLIWTNPDMIENAILRPS